jgi:hypothetical protein
MALSSYEQIRQLADLIRRLAQKKPEIVVPFREERTTAQGRFLSLLDNSEEQTLKALQTSASAPSYQVMKSTVLKRLLNSLFFIDVTNQEGAGELACAKFSNDRNLFICKTLSFFALKDISEQISKKELLVAERYELTSNAIEYLNILINGATTGGDESVLRTLCDKQRRLFGAYRAETELFARLSQLQLQFVRRGSDSAEAKDALYTLAFEAEAAQRVHGSFKLAMMTYRLKSTLYQALGSHAENLHVCLDAEKYIASKPQFQSKTRLAEFALRRLVCAVHLRDKSQGLSAARICLDAYQRGSYNWFVTQEHLFLLHMTALDFEAAAHIFDLVNSQGQFDGLAYVIKERWSLYELYLLYAQGSLSKSHKLRFRKEVEARDFLRYVPSYSKDKTGLNLSALILHVLFLFEKQDFESLKERVSSLDAYRSRHLKGKSPQTDIFIQLISILPNSSLLREDAVRETASLHKALVSAAERPQGEETLILPLEWLWGRVLAALPSS